jgi:hypothetical protein
MKVKRLAAAVALLPVSAALTLVSEKPASAVAGGCGGDVCAEATHVSGNVVTIRAWARNSSFYGHFELQTPNHRTLNSIQSIWHAGGTGNYFNNINGGVGRYCVTAWEYFSGQYGEMGYTCFNA